MRVYSKVVWQWVDGKLTLVPSETVSYEYEGSLALCVAMFGVAQNAYRFFEDGTETGSTALGTQNTALTRDVTVDSNIQLRIRIQETGGANGATTDDYQLQANIAGAGFTNVTTTSTGVKGFNSASLTDAGTTTNRLGAGSGSFVAGEISETGLVTDRQVTASNYMELLYSLTLVAADLADGNAITFRVLVNGSTMTYNVTPTLNVTQAVTQSLTPSLFTNTNSFHVPTVSVGAVTISPSLYTDGDTFHAPTVSAEEEEREPPGSWGGYIGQPIGGGIGGTVVIAEAEAQQLTPDLFTNTQTFFAPTISATYSIAPSIYQDADIVFDPTVSAGAVTVSPSLYTNTQTFFVPTVAAGAVTLSPSLFTNTQSVFAPTITAGVVTLTPALFTNTNTFFAPTVTVGAVTIAPDLYTNTNTFFAPTVSAAYTIAPNLYTNTQTFFAPTVTVGAVTLSPNFYTNTHTFFVPAFMTGEGQVFPDLFTNTQTFFAPEIAAGAITLTPDLYTNTQTFFVPEVSAGAITITPDLYSDADQFFAPSITQGAIVAPALYTNTSMLFVPAVTVGVVTVSPALYTDVDAFFAPTVTAAYTIAPDLYSDADAFFAPTLVADPTQTLFPSLVTSTNIIHQPLFEGGAARRTTTSKRTLGRLEAVRSNVETARRSNVQSSVVKRAA